MAWLVLALPILPEPGGTRLNANTMKPGLTHAQPYDYEFDEIV